MGAQGEVESVVVKALGTMGDRPVDLSHTIATVADLREVKLPAAPLEWLADNLQADSLGGVVHHALGLQLRTWDRVDGDWTNGTAPWSDERRQVIFSRLHLKEPMRRLLEVRFPCFDGSERPVVVSDDHKPWYFEHRKLERFYWNAYSSYLLNRKWTSAAVAKLDAATDAVIERISDPAGVDAYQAKGLVVGYVQSGKTAHFTGVLAKAADAGYRLIIVLTGTIDILRQQTQRRLDKELIGKELLGDEYAGASDWQDFISHGGLPSNLGSFDWQRLTGSEGDYRSLAHGIAALEFKGQDGTKPFNDIGNLRLAPARLIVVKKVPSVLRHLARDLSRLRSRLDQVPTLMVDDESDQASINTINPDKVTERTRTATNDEITKLLRVLPRAQYIGYTATPFANVLVNPADDKDLFPRDFIIGLPRPDGYMGVADFYDLGEPKDGFASNQRAFVRDVRGTDEEPGNLQCALDSFVLAGALKLFRTSKKGFSYRHHTMLVHHATQKYVHQEQADAVGAIFEGGAYHAGKGLARLNKLFEDDFRPVSLAQAPDLAFPKRFEDIRPFISQCLQRISADIPVRIVNGDNRDQTPDFDRGPVWSILIGGAKLSRGYTVEGLTTTYFRRVSSASDTLMQMGRWYGFRFGYRDLVRLFIGRDEQVGKKLERMDLYEAFRAMCLDEEEFRADIRRYVDIQGIRPIDVHPLIPSHLASLRPTAANKMHYSAIASRNFGDSLIQRTVASTDKDHMAANDRAAQELLASMDLESGRCGTLSVAKKHSTFECIKGIASAKAVLKFLEAYVWRAEADILKLEVEFLKGTSRHGEAGIKDWLVLAPQLKEPSNGTWPSNLKRVKLPLTIKERSRVGDRFGVYTEPEHVAVARLLVGAELPGLSLDRETAALAARGRAVMLLYPVIPTDNHKAGVTIGFALQLPKNKLSNQIYYTAEGRKAVPRS